MTAGRPRMTNAEKRRRGVTPGRMNVHELELPPGPVTAPAWLSAAARVEFDRLATELRPILSEPDSTTLAVLAEAIVDLVRYRRLLRKAPLITDEDGVTRRNPALFGLQAAQNTVTALLRELGMSPAARVRVLDRAPAKPDSSAGAERLLS